MGGTRDADADARSWIATTVSESIGVTGTDGAGVSLASDGGAREVLFASDGIAGALGQLQFTLGEGPCIHAAVTGSTVLADDPSGGQGLTDRWPAFAREAARAVAHALFAFPIPIGPVRLGTCASYRMSPGSLDTRQLTAALSTVDAVGLRSSGCARTARTGSSARTRTGTA